MKDVKKIVRQRYRQIAKSCGSSCCSKKVASEIGYEQDDVQLLQDSNLGLGCGNPTAKKLETQDS